MVVLGGSISTPYPSELFALGNLTLHIHLNCVWWGSGSLRGSTPYPSELFAIGLLKLKGLVGVL